MSTRESRTWLRTAWTVAAAVLPWGCGSLDGFQCRDDAQCRRGENVGTCTEVGYCAYPDPTCPSGQRYSSDATEAIADACVEMMAEHASSGSTAADPTSAASSSDGGESSSAEATTAAPQPVCGDGIVDGDEQCDDANAQAADGCNPDCRPSGTLVESFTSDLPGYDLAQDLLLLPDGEIVVAGEAARDAEGRDALLARYAADGTPRWTTYRAGSAHINDRAQALAITPSGTVLFAGWIVPAASGTTTPRAQIILGSVDPADGAIIWDALDGAAPPSNDQAWDLLAPDDTTAIITGRIGPNATQEFLVRAYAIDPDAANTTVTTSWSRLVQGVADRSDAGFALIPDAAGRLVAAGFTRPTTADIDRRLEVFLADGTSPRPPCRDDGSTADVRVPEGNDQIRALALAPDGRVAAAGFGERTEADGIDAWVGLYEPEGCVLKWQRTVSGDAGSRDEANGVAVDSQGTIVTVGFVRDTNSDDLWVAKWNADGEMLWQAEPVNGPGDAADHATSVVIDTNDDIIVAGWVSKPGESDVWVGRYTP